MPKILGSRGLKLVDRLRQFFDYRETEPKYEPVQLDKLITMVMELGGRYGAGAIYDVRDWGDFTRAVAGGAGVTNILTVPEWERIIVESISVARVSGDGTLTLLNAISRSGGNEVNLRSQTAASGIYLNESVLGFPHVFDRDMGIQAYCNALTGDTVWKVTWKGASIRMRVDRT